MGNIKVTITKSRVGLRRVNEDYWEETGSSRVDSYQMETSIGEDMPEAKQRAIQEAASKVSGMNQYALNRAKEDNQSNYLKLIVTGV